MSERPTNSEPEGVRPGYLVLRRRAGEQIRLLLPNQEEIILTTLECHSSNTKLGIQAPPEIIIVRAELLE